MMVSRRIVERNYSGSPLRGCRRENGRLVVYKSTEGANDGKEPIGCLVSVYVGHPVDRKDG